MKPTAHNNQNRRKKANNKQACFLAITFVLLVALGIGGAFFLRYIAFQQLSSAESPSPRQFFITALFSLLVLIAVLGQAAIYFFQWLAMRDVIRQNESVIRAVRRQAKASERGLDLTGKIYYESQRAYVHIAKMKLERLGNQTVRTSMLFANKGQTPAWDVTPRFRYVTGTFPIDESPIPDFPEPHAEQIMAEIVPDETSHWLIVEPFSISEEEWAWIQSKTRALVITVKTTYRCIQDGSITMVSHHLYIPEYNAFSLRKEWPTGFSIGWGGEGVIDESNHRDK